MDGESSRHKRLKTILQEQSSEPHGLPLKYLREITNDFSDERLLGNGGFGNVYKGVVQNGDLIAVKKLTLTTPEIQNRQFENEVRHLMGLKHPNIVQLVGYCSDTEIIPVEYNGIYVHAEKRERLICLEYLPRGSLCDHLSDESSGLEWETRYKIIEGICYGLHYLHEEQKVNTSTILLAKRNTSIIHMDLKPSNILLDDNMVPKIADFGLSRLFGEEQTRTCTKSCLGTLGYMAPEYIDRGIITKKLDIFSLGVIIIEIMTGHKDYPYENETSSQKFMELVLKNWRNRLEKAPGYASQEIYCQQIRRCIQIGLVCVKLDWEQRPTTPEVIKILHGSEEVRQEGTSAEAEGLAAAEAEGKNTSIRLRFLNGIKSPIYVDREIKSEENAAIRIGIFDGDKMIRFGPLSRLNVEILALEGNFPYDPLDSWTAEEFNEHRASGSDGKGYMMGSEGTTVQLISGERDLGSIRFKKSSFRARNGMFIIGARVQNYEAIGFRVQEAVMKPVHVHDHRNKRFEKHYPPKLGDEVWRLEKIGKNGAYNQALSNNGIDSVQKFLQAYMKGEERLKQMSITPLSDLQPRRLDYVICVRVSRMWEFRGANEENEIKHQDLILIDREGNSIYAEAPPDAISYVKPHLQEGKIVYMTKITIDRAKPVYRPVQNPYMIKLNRKTEILEAHDQPPEFPKYTFSLTPFEKLPEYTKKTEYFLDIIGRIIRVSNAAMVSTASGDLMMRRVIKLQDLKENTIELSLSGKRAGEFPGETIFEVGQNNHVIAIFVGTLMKLYREQYQFLSNTSACRWYINENEIREIKAFQRSLPAQVTPVQRLYLQGEDDTHKKFEQRTLLDLKDIDPFLEKGKNYECTVIITSLARRQTWCYRACKVCNSRVKPDGKAYECTNKDCSCTQFDWKYKIPFIGTDGTYSLEFVLFEKKGLELIGKPAESLRKQYDIFETPPEISAWIGHKFTFVVRVLTKKSIQTPDPSFEVIRIKQKFGNIGNIIPEIRSSIPITEKESLPPLVPIISTKIEHQTPSSQIQLPGDIQSMELEPSGIWDDSDISNKRNYGGIANDNLQANDEDENQQKGTKKLRLQPEPTL